MNYLLTITNANVDDDSEFFKTLYKKYTNLFNGDVKISTKNIAMSLNICKFFKQK